MVWKIFLPVLIGVLLYYLGKSHARRRQIIPTVLRNTGESRWRQSFRLAAISLVISALLIAVMVLFNDWRSSQQKVQVRVIHVETGEVVIYQALRGQVHGRTFQTIDGRQVRLADVERMEVGE
ncbi:hypothetical protein [Candidatus Magnetaquicoccus inordinatus]|uniref:hypothetical protein n=1 Tax=Candidatus Magnetaquicoccus inordinatus TaxID=2496818 RepID=UPI00102D02D4|nr:hypothetical protein [Candidatus Magnetaquicoccus inordinatus]